MKIFEITSAEEQLSLLRVIIDNTWSAIAAQADQQKKVEQQKKQARSKSQLSLKSKLRAVSPKAQVKKPQAVTPRSTINPNLASSKPNAASQKLVKPGFQAMQVAR